MKISIWIPNDANLQNKLDFVSGEIHEANNIKSKKNRKIVISSLSKIKHYMKESGVGHCYYSDGNEINVEPYDGKINVYYCDKEYNNQ